MPFSIAGTKWITMEGLQEAQDMLSEFQGEPIKNPTAVLIALGDQIVSEMQMLAPVDTGFMQSEIAVTEVGDDHVRIESPASYSGFVEYGTHKMEPQPFFEPPIENFESQYLQVVIDEVIQNMNDLIAKHNPYRGGFRSLGPAFNPI